MKSISSPATAQFVVLEKSHGLETYGSTEKGIIATAPAAEGTESQVKVLFTSTRSSIGPVMRRFESYRDEWRHYATARGRL